MWQCMCALRATAAARIGQSVRRQGCCDSSAEGGAVRGTLCAIVDLCACCANCAERVRCDCVVVLCARMLSIPGFLLSRVAE